MALINDPTDLADSTDAAPTSQEVYIDTANKTIGLNITGALSTDGVTLKALYSFLKEQWKDDPNTKNLPAFPFPMTPITDESFELTDGWDFDADASRYLIRTGGWTVRNTSAAVTQKWAGIIGLGAIESNDQLYFYQGSGSTITDIQLTGQVNQAVRIYLDTNGDGTPDEDYTANFTLFVREQGQIFGQADLVDIGVTVMDSIAYRFPISTSTDLKIVVADTAIKATPPGYPADTAPYDAMTITYLATPQAQTGLVGGSFNFGIVIDGNGQTLQKVYEFVQYALRQDADINDDTPSVITGKVADPLLYYVGDTLYTQAATNPDGGGTGVLITNFDTNDQNSVVFVDNLGSERVFPYVATLTLSFNSNLVSDTAAEYWVYYTTLPVAPRSVSDAAITTATTTLTSATAAFVANDVDALITIGGAGAAAADLTTRIVSVTSATEVEVADAASTTVSAETLDIYTGSWGSRGALIVKDASDADMVGAANSTTIVRTYDFDGNTQGNRVAPAVPAVTAIAIGLDTGQYVRATGTIARSKSNAVALVAPLERNYDNP